MRLVSVLRASDWWAYKLAAVIGTAYGTALVLDVPLRAVWPDLLLALLALGVGAAYASLVNDAFDTAEDAASGKRNHFVGRPPVVAGAALVLVALAGFACTRPLAAHGTAMSLYWFNWLVFAAYSVPPLRLKARGLGGVLAIAVGENLVPHLFTMALVADAGSAPLPPAWIAGVALWSLACGARSIVWHQMQDAEGDRLAGVSTWVVRVTSGVAARRCVQVIFPAEVAGLLLMLASLGSAWTWSALVVYAVTEAMRSAWWRLPVRIVRTEPGARLVLFEFYEFFLPVACLAAAVAARPSDWPVLLVHLAAFPGRLVWWSRDFWGLLRWEAWGRIRRPGLPTRDAGKAHPPDNGTGGPP